MNYIQSKTLGFFVKTKGVFSYPFYSGRGLVLTLHRVRPENQMSKMTQNKNWEITPELLENIIKYFKKKNFCFLKTSEIQSFMLSKDTRKFIVFTMDDGYLDNLDFAYPVFRKHKVPFTVFLSTSFVLNKRYPWEIILENYLLKQTSLKFNFNSISFAYNYGNDKERSNIFNIIYALIKKNNNPNFLNIVLREIFGNFLYSDECKSIKMIQAKHIIGFCNEELIDFGNHTKNHYTLSQLSYKEQLEEINEAGKDIQSLTGKMPTQLAYPFGGPNDINTDTYKAAKESNINIAFAFFPANLFTSNDMLLIPRFNVDIKTTEKELNYLINGIRHFSYNGFNKTTFLKQKYKI